MIVTEKLIEKFFLKKCTVQEAEAVADYLRNHAEVLERYLSKVEWDAEMDIDSKTDDFWEEIWHAIKPIKKKNQYWRTVAKYSVAASLVMLIFLAIHFSGNQPRQENRHYSALFKHQIIKNNSGFSKNIPLSDGSKVEISAHSRIEYDEPFQHNKREIVVHGEALFNVAKDKARPFIVHSGQITTTALGTSFRVISNLESDQIMVYLYEGKVVITSPSNGKNRAIDSVYLHHGGSFIYNKITEEVRVSYKNNKKTTANKKFLEFHKEPLSLVFDQLADKYNVHIQYSTDDFANIYYIGRFDKADSVESILRNIAKLNDLRLDKISEQQFVIQKDVKKL